MSIMTQTTSAESGSDYRMSQPPFPQSAGMPDAGRAFPPAAFDDLPGTETGTFSDLLRTSGIALTPAEVRELAVFEEFLSRHVQPDTAWDVQCMLLWSEWVRVFRRHGAGFPNLIREREFRAAVAGRFGAGIATDSWRGRVYTGIRFVP